MINAGGTTTLRVTLSAPPATCTPAPVTPAFTEVGFTDDVPPGLVLGDPAVIANTCGQRTLAASAGGATFTLAGASLAPGQTCDVTVGHVTVVSEGDKRNVIPRIGGAGIARDFVNDQGVEALADADANLIVVVRDIPILSLPAQAVLTAAAEPPGRRGAAATGPSTGGLIVAQVRV